MDTQPLQQNSQNQPAQPNFWTSRKINKKIMIFGGIAIIATALAGGVYVWQTWEIARSNLPIIVDRQDLVCEADSDCSKVFLECGCSGAPVNAQNQNKYAALGEKKRANCPKIMCEMDTRKPICVNRACKLSNESDINIKNWQTYRNEQYGFEVRYPTSNLLENAGRILLDYDEIEPNIILSGRFYKPGTEPSTPLGNLAIHGRSIDEIKDEKIKEVAKIIKEVMENPPIKLIVPIKVEIRAGKNWGNLKPITNN